MYRHLGRLDQIKIATQFKVSQAEGDNRRTRGVGGKQGASRLWGRLVGLWDGFEESGEQAMFMEGIVGVGGVWEGPRGAYGVNRLGMMGGSLPHTPQKQGLFLVPQSLCPQTNNPPRELSPPSLAPLQLTSLAPDISECQ